MVRLPFLVIFYESVRDTGSLIMDQRHLIKWKFDSFSEAHAWLQTNRGLVALLAFILGAPIAFVLNRLK